MSSSTSRLLVDYFRTRFPAWLVIALTLVIIAPALVSGKLTSAGEIAIALGMALLLLVEFRLWDDLCDRQQDCLEDPRRVLCRVESIQPFIVMLLLLMVGNLALVASQCMGPAVAILLVLHGLLAIWYAIRTPLKTGPVTNYHVVLLKYPAFGFMLGSSMGVAIGLPLSASLAVVYLGLCIAEVLHDPRLRARRSAWICLWIELLLLAGIIVAGAARALMTGSGEGTS